MDEFIKQHDEQVRADERNKIRKQLVDLAAQVSKVEATLGKLLTSDEQMPKATPAAAKEPRTQLGPDETHQLEMALWGAVTTTPVTCTELAKAVRWEPHHVSAVLAKMIKEGQIRRTGKGKATRYFMVPVQPEDNADGQAG